MINYEGWIFSTEEAMIFYNKIKGCYDVGTLKFESKDSLNCRLQIDGEDVSESYVCESEDEKEQLIEIAKENSVGVSW